jgi:hypothetical protein
MTNKAPEAPPSVADILAPLKAKPHALQPHELQGANADLSIHTLRSILRDGDERTSGITQALPIAEALATLAQERRQTAETYEAVAETLRTLYPDRRVPLAQTREAAQEGEEYMVRLAQSGEPLRAIARAFGISVQAVLTRIRAHEERTGEKIPRYGKPYAGWNARAGDRFARTRLKDAMTVILNERGQATVPEIVKALREGGFKATRNLDSNAYRSLRRLVAAGEVEKNGASYVKSHTEAGRE